MDAPKNKRLRWLAWGKSCGRGGKKCKDASYSTQRGGKTRTESVGRTSTLGGGTAVRGPIEKKKKRANTGKQKVKLSFELEAIKKKVPKGYCSQKKSKVVTYVPCSGMSTNSGR